MVDEIGNLTIWFGTELETFYSINDQNLASLSREWRIRLLFHKKRKKLENLYFQNKNWDRPQKTNVFYLSFF